MFASLSCALFVIYERQGQMCTAQTQNELLSSLCRSPADFSEGDDGQGPESMSTHDQMRVRWENLSKDLNNKLQLSLNTMEQTPCSTVHNQSSFVF